jgi:hypothetical protein
MPEAGWAELVAAAPIGEVRRGSLVSHDEATLDQLATELNEYRSFETSGH